MRAAELLDHVRMHSSHVEDPPSTFLTGAAVDEIMPSLVGSEMCIRDSAMRQGRTP